MEVKSYPCDGHVFNPEEFKTRLYISKNLLLRVFHNRRLAGAELYLSERKSSRSTHES